MLSAAPVEDRCSAERCREPSQPVIQCPLPADEQGRLAELGEVKPNPATKAWRSDSAEANPRRRMTTVNGSRVATGNREAPDRASRTNRAGVRPMCTAGRGEPVKGLAWDWSSERCRDVTTPMATDG